MIGHDAEIDLRAFLSALPHAAVIVTAASAGGTERAGCLVGFHTQCSIDPLHVMVCLSKANHTMGVADRAVTLTVHYPGVDDRDLAELFGGTTGDSFDKFDHCDWRWDVEHRAILLDRIAHLWIGEISRRVPLGDHVGFILRPTVARMDATYHALDTRALADVDPGHPRETS